MKDSLLLFIDFEFTMPEGKENPIGFFPEIIEAGYFAVSGQKVIEKFSSYVIPSHFPHLTARCKSFLKITQQQVSNGMAFEKLIERLSYLNKQAPTTVITWGNMDMKVLKQNCAKLNIPFPLHGTFRDLSMEYKKFFGDRNHTGLWKAVEEYGKEGTGKHHRALDDAITTYHLFKLVEKDKKYLAKPEPTTIGERIDLSKMYQKFAT
ncbi:3'-5' exonuclease KapD [Metabacillus arenae]|uniref:3'-5' exonuclease KapD n=1 Tax=Metabacillus arenae TaxID=2771434 RepID=A0A926NE48_9BACI|nr:3'-5' exonuclease KapD [Metabacillus arenae]MBD1382582.1 3'-5' exonuclease KapD [Metabacillus arenae]